VASRKRSAPKQAATAPPATVEFEPSVRRFVDWTSDLCKQAEVSADSGSYRSAARLCEWILTDDRVSAALNVRIQALLGLEPTFEASGDKRRSNRAVKALDAGEDWWASYPEPETALILKWGLVLGFAWGQHQWVESDDKRWLPTPEFWHPYNVSHDNNKRVWKTWVASEGIGGATREVEIEAGDSQWLMHCPFGKHRPHAWGLWHGLWPLVLLKQLARQDWSRASERAGILALTTEHDEAAEQFNAQSRQIREQLARDIYNRGRNAVAALPPGFDLKLVQTVANTEALFNAQIEMANTAIAIMIRGGNLGTENDGGSRAATESQARTGDLTNLRFDAQSWTTTVHDQSLVWWAKFNYGDPKLAPWPVYPVEPEADIGKKAEADSKALANVDTAEKLGFDVDRQAFLDEHKLSSWCKPGERPPEPIAPEPDTEEDSDDDPESEDADDREPSGSGDGPGAGVSPEAGHTHHVQANGSAGGFRLATGPIAAGTTGFLAGQLYADALVDSATAFSQELLAPTLDAIKAALAESTDYESLRENLRKRYEDLDPETLMELVEHHLVIAHLAGRAAVNQDA
jgi:hypothetical protein